MSTRLFVYGTLRAARANAARQPGRRVPGGYVTVQAWPLYLCGERCSPCLLDAPGCGLPVRGELVEVDAAGLRVLDALERVTAPDGYRRVGLAVRTMAGGEALRVQAYVKAAEHAPAPWVGPLAEYLPEHDRRYRPRTGG